MKGLKIAGKVLLYVLVVLILLLLVLRLGVTAMYFDYFSNSESQFLVPGLTTAFVPQGLEYAAGVDCYLMSGYMNDGSASRVYVRDGEGETRFVELRNNDGTDYTRHAGGICTNGEYVYLAGKNGVEVFLLSDFMNGTSAVNVGRIETGYDVACCTYYNGYLLAADFYYPETYETPAEHRITTPAGDANTALITVFKANEGAQFGIDPTPVAAFSITGKVQGLCMTSEKEIVLSTSYGFATSHLYFYDIDTTRSSTIALMDTQVPLYYLDSANLTDTVELPPMSEEIICRDGKILVMCESACNKYIFGKFIRGYQVFAYDFQNER